MGMLCRPRNHGGFASHALTSNRTLLLLLTVFLTQFQLLDGWETRIRHNHRRVDPRLHDLGDNDPRHRRHGDPGANDGQTTTDAFYRENNATDYMDSAVPKLKDGPVFRSLNNTVVYAHAGSTISLPCLIHKDTNHGVITWGYLEQRGRLYTLLTVGDSPYTDNLRFSIEKPIRHDQWNLLIKPVELEDDGLYECQATTHPPQAIVVKLVVAEAYAEIVGTNEKVFKSESKLQLVCVLHKATSRPEYIFWYHNNRMINYDSDKGIKVVEDANGSTLTISSVRPSHSGNYSCEPSHLRPDSVTVTILAESKSANALQDKQASKAAGIASGEQAAATASMSRLGLALVVGLLLILL